MNDYTEVYLYMKKLLFFSEKGKKKKSMYHHELEHDVSNILLSRKSQTLKGTVILHTLRK